MVNRVMLTIGAKFVNFAQGAVAPVSTLVFSLSAMVAALAAPEALAGEAPLLSLSIEHFRDTASVEDDPIAGVTTVTTEKGFLEHHGLLNAVWDDEYLRGTIDRKSGHTSFEVITTLTYRGQRRIYSVAKFSGVNGTSGAPTVPLRTSAVNCPTGECTYTDRVSFVVEEELLRKVATASPNGPTLWHYSLAARSTQDYSGQFSSAEIAGFLAKVDEFTGAAPPKTARSQQSAKIELGIGALHVEPSEQQPARAGVLVTAVRNGSLAAKVGLIVGDIVDRIDGHSVSTPPEVQAAIAAGRDGQSFEIHLFRGTSEMTLTGKF